MKEFIVLVQPPVPNVKVYRIKAVDATDAGHRLRQKLESEGKARLIGPRSTTTIIAPNDFEPDLPNLLACSK